MTEITAGTQLGPYRIEALLGSGGMGRVYKARDTRLARDVAIKILPQDKLADADRKRRFLQEARAASALMHPNIIVVHDISSDAGMDFLVMEYVRGKTLQERIKPGALPAVDVARYGAQIASALAAAHAVGIVHRDIKPANIMITPESQIKVLDFGLAKLAEPAGIAPDNETLTMAAVTEPGIVVGTVAYMSPEQTRGEPLDGSSDIFSLGCVLYEAATGKKPFQGPSMLAVMHEIATANPAPPSVTNRNLPADFDRVIERALCKDKSERYQSATEMMEALQALESRPAAPAARRPANKRKRWLAAGVSALLVAAGFAAFQQWETRRGIDSIAVLPFTSNDREASTETLTDGLTEDIINRLTQAGDLKVMASATVFHYKGQSLDPRTIGRQLGVRAVLVGRISKSGDQATVRGDLVNVNDGSQLWGKQYNRALSQLQTIGQEMAQEIADRVRPNGKDQPRLTKHHIADPLAYQLYLQGRRNIREYTEHGFRQSIVDFQNAVNRDPAYAAAWAGLADAYSYLAAFELQAPGEVMPKAKDNAIKALELDSEAAEAYTSLGIVALTYDWDWPLAERRFRRALALNPGDAFTLHWLGHYYESMGKWQDALSQMQRALDMDPLSPMFGEDMAWDLFTLGRYEEAARQLRKTVDLAPQDPYARALLALALEATGKSAQGLEEAEKARQLPGMFVTAFSLSGVFCRLGKPEVAREILKQLQAAQKKSYVAPFELAGSHFALGEKKAGMDRVRDAVKERSGMIPLMVSDPVFDSVRGDPEFAALMNELRLPEAAWSKVPRISK